MVIDHEHANLGTPIHARRPPALRPDHGANSVTCRPFAQAFNSSRLAPAFSALNGAWAGRPIPHDVGSWHKFRIEGNETGGHIVEAKVL
jgi:hypothetical protein